MIEDEKYMRLAIQLAELGRGFTSPNPLVGAVIVKKGRIVGVGYHKKQGLPHAEVNAIFDARGHTEGATMYVTLEPHSFYGHQPPCTNAIIRAGIKRVVIGTIDPNPRVNGTGVRQLQEAGIEVKVGVLEDKVIEQNEVYFKYTKTGLPFVYLKLAATLDGFIADYKRKSQWISGPGSRKLDHKWRGEVDAIAVGKGTLIHDDPQLTPRDVYPAKYPTRIIIASKLDFKETFKVFDTKVAKTAIVTVDDSENKVEAKRFEKSGVEVWFVDANKDGRVNLSSAIKLLGEKCIRSVLFEGGAHISGELIEQDLWDKIYLFFSPFFLGDGVNILEGVKKELGESRRFKIVSSEKIEEDILLILKNERENR